MNKTAIIDKVMEITARAGRERSVEPVEVELVGGGGHRVLRIFIDRTDQPGGVTHDDCQFISEYVGTVLDVEEVIAGGSYTLEVSSPGVERKLNTPRDFERHQGQTVRVVTREPIEGRTVWEGTLTAATPEQITVQAMKKGVPEASAQIPLKAITRANLKFEW